MNGTFNGYIRRYRTLRSNIWGPITPRIRNSKRSGMNLQRRALQVWRSRPAAFDYLIATLANSRLVNRPYPPGSPPTDPPTSGLRSDGLVRRSKDEYTGLDSTH